MSLQPIVLMCALTLMASGGCEPATTVQPWSIACDRNADCTLMPFGDRCRSCAEVFGAVSIGEVEPILSDAEGAGNACPFWTDWTVDVCATEPTSAPVCEQGICKATTNGVPCAPGGTGLCQGVD